MQEKIDYELLETKSKRIKKLFNDILSTDYGMFADFNISSVVESFNDNSDWKGNAANEFFDSLKKYFEILSNELDEFGLSLQNSLQNVISNYKEADQITTSKVEGE